MFPNRKHHVVLVLCVILEVSSSPHLINQDLNEVWNSYKGMYGKHYESYEDGARRYMWETNTKKIMKHNLLADIGVHSYWMEVNKFADWTAEELQILRTCLAPTNFVDTAEEVFRHKLDFQLPDSVDWRTKGYVTEIKDQRECGSCWAFSATGSLEGQHKAKTGTLVSLSEQNLVDCSWKEGNEGCDGGYMSNAFRYVQNNKGIDTEESYPYTGLDGDCKFKRSTVGATCEGYAKVLRGNETSLQAATATIGPISVAIDAADDFMFYSRGIFYDPTCSSEELNHGVLVVGYGSKGTKDYWIVKNSWGTSWGMDGYVLMSRNRRNNCGIASMATYPLM